MFRLVKRLPSGDFILSGWGFANGSVPVVQGNLYFFVTRQLSNGQLETYDASDGTWKASGLTNPGYGIQATHRKENGNATNTGIWTAVVPGGSFADATRYTYRFAAYPNNVFYQMVEFELAQA